MVREKSVYGSIYINKERIPASRKALSSNFTDAEGFF